VDRVPPRARLRVFPARVPSGRREKRVLRMRVPVGRVEWKVGATREGEARLGDRPSVQL
jgi:hypothetical protein